MSSKRKVMNIVFDDEICYESLLLFTNYFNEAISKKRDVKLYFSSIGGVMMQQKTMSRIVNNFPYNVEVYCDGFLLSAGIPFILELKKEIPVYIGEDLVAMAHMPSIVLESRNTKKQSGFDKFFLDNDAVMCERYLEPIKPILTEKEIQLVKDGEDVMLDAIRFKKLLEISRS
jgi:hypothetical protein